MYLSKVRVQGMRASVEGPIEVELPGRFSVIAGGNSAGKTTFADAAYLAHASTFPRLPKPSSAVLGTGERNIELTYNFSPKIETEGPLGRRIQSELPYNSTGSQAVSWSRVLTRDLGRVGTRFENKSPYEDSVKFIYLPAWRNPIDELARREARILVELLRAQQQNLGRGRNIYDLRRHASALLSSLSDNGLLKEMEDRVNGHLRSLSAGVSRNWSYIRGQAVDDNYLARVLEFMLAVVEDKTQALPLETGGLGYVNLLHIAITLAAIPDLSAPAPDAEAEFESDTSPNNENLNDSMSEQEATDRFIQAEAEKESEEDSFFSTEPFHATVLIEEPEAHLHPQLQTSLTRYLRRVTRERPELQVILSSHSPAVITSCDPRELVVMRRNNVGQRVSRAVGMINFKKHEEVLRNTRLHLDASRSAALFADTVLLVEGVTEAAICREFGHIWANADLDKEAFIDALSIVPMGTKVGPWAVRLLATKDHEICSKVAVLRDSDLAFDQTPVPPSWAADHDASVLFVAQSHPTLEPELARSNPKLVASALAEVGLEVPEIITPQSVGAIFQSGKRATDTIEAKPPGPGAKRKAEFALTLAGLVKDSSANFEIVVPEPMKQAFDFLYVAVAPSKAPHNHESDDNVDAENGSGFGAGQGGFGAGQEGFDIGEDEYPF